LTLVTSCCVPCCCNLVIEGVEGLCLGAVHVEPPVADKVLLVKQGSVGAEEGELAQASCSIPCADVERLALPLRICIVPTIHLAVAGERGLRRLGIDGIILARSAGDVLF